MDEANAIDGSKPPPDDAEMGWEYSGPSSYSTTAQRPPVIPTVETFDERIMAKQWTLALRMNWVEQPNPPPRRLNSESLARVVAVRNPNSFERVFARPPESRWYTKVGIAIIVPSEDRRNEDLPPDRLANTDISQLLQVPYTFVDTRAGVTSMLDALQPLAAKDEPRLAVDLEGLRLGKRG